MSSDLAKDRFVSHSILNYLLASYQGKFSATSALLLMGYSDLNEEDLSKIQSTLARIMGWQNLLRKDECLFSASWTSAETFDSQNALHLLTALKPDLYQLSLDLIQVLTLKELPSTDQVKFLLAGLARSVYAKDTFIRGHIDYGLFFGLPDIAQRFSLALPVSEDEVEQVHKLLNVFRASLENSHRLEEDFYRSLYFVSMELPFSFRSHIHDINQLLSQFEGEFDFQAAEFVPAEASQWQEAGLGPVPAGYWRAYNVGPEEAKAWSEAKFVDASVAYRWKTLGFSPDSGSPWLANEFSPDYAALWAASGYTPDKAKEMITKGIKRPPAALPEPDETPA